MLKLVVSRFGLVVSLAVLAACSRPDWTDVEGHAYRWSQFQNQPVVVNVWAQWCAPCREEIPELNALYQQQAALGVQVFGLHFDRPDSAALSEQIAAMQVAFPVMFDIEDQTLKDLWPEVLPSTYLFNAKGELITTLIGPQTKESILAAIGGEHE